LFVIARTNDEAIPLMQLRLLPPHVSGVAMTRLWFCFKSENYSKALYSNIKKLLGFSLKSLIMSFIGWVAIRNLKIKEAQFNNILLDFCLRNLLKLKRR
jgi:hypothetical protein